MDAICIPLAIHHHYLFDFENYHGHVLFIRELVFHLNFRLNFEVDYCHLVSWQFLFQVILKKRVLCYGLYELSNF